MSKPNIAPLFFREDQNFVERKRAGWSERMPPSRSALQRLASEKLSLDESDLPAAELERSRRRLSVTA